MVGQIPDKEAQLTEFSVSRLGARAPHQSLPALKFLFQFASHVVLTKKARQLRFTKNSIIYHEPYYIFQTDDGREKSGPVTITRLNNLHIHTRRLGTTTLTVHTQHRKQQQQLEQEQQNASHKETHPKTARETQAADATKASEFSGPGGPWLLACAARPYL